MPSFPTPTAPPPIRAPQLHRLYLSSHLVFLDGELPASTLSSHYRALLLDARSTPLPLAPLAGLWHLLDALLLRVPRSALPACLPPPRGRFWPLVTAHALRGELPPARELVAARLREAPDWPSRVASLRLRDGRVDPLAALEHVLEGGDASWRAAVAAWAASEELAEDADVRTVMQVLVGDVAAVRAVAADWREMFVALVVAGSDPRDAVHDARQMVPPAPSELADWDIVRLAVGRDCEGLLQSIHVEYGAFFAAHFGDVLFRKGLVDKRVRAHHISNYCRMLQETGGSWRVTVDYLLRIGEKHSIGTVLNSVPITGAGDPTAEKLYLVAARTGNAADVCRRIAEMCRNDRNFGGCMVWYLRGGLHEQVTDVCDELLREAERAGAGSTQGTQLGYVVAALRQPGTAQIELPHICAYHDFQECIMKLRELAQSDSAPGDAEERETAVRNLCMTGVELLQGLPRAFWGVIVYDILQTIRPETDGVYMSRGVLTSMLQGLDSPDKGLRNRLSCENRGMQVEQALHASRTTLTKLFSTVV